MSDNLEARFRERVAALRTEFGLSQAELGRRTGYSQQSIFKIEHGEQGIKLDDAQRFADALGVPLLDLLSPDLSDSQGLLKSFRTALDVAEDMVTDLDGRIATLRVELDRYEHERDDARADVARYRIRIHELERAVRRASDPKKPRRK